MNFLNRKVLYVNLKQHSFEVKTYPDLHKYLGGLPLGLKLLEMNNAKSPLIFAVGPLNGLFPYVSKTCILETSPNSIGVEEYYLGGSLSSRIRFAGFDALVILGKSEEPVFLEINPTSVSFHSSREDFVETALPGRSSRLSFDKTLLLDGYFHTDSHMLAKTFAERNLGGVIVNATASFDMKTNSAYEKIYHALLKRKDRLRVTQGNNSSCITCPMGCEKSQIGETEGNVFVHSLVACQYASDIYSDLGVVFSCLNALGYEYTHEELEKIPDLVKNLMGDLKSL
jgi:hypothetical protein